MIPDQKVILFARMMWSSPIAFAWKMGGVFRFAWTLKHGMQLQKEIGRKELLHHTMHGSESFICLLGLRNEPGPFQLAISAILSKINWQFVLVYQDYIAI